MDTAAKQRDRVGSVLPPPPRGWARAIAGTIAKGHPGAAWLDGAELGRSFAGLFPDLEHTADSLDGLDEVERAWRADPSRIWIGWLTYELGANRLLRGSSRPVSLTGLCMRRYSAALSFEADHGVARVHGRGRANGAMLGGVLERADAEAKFDHRWPLEPLRPTLTAAEHRRRVRVALRHIADGDSYQINLSQPFESRWIQPPADLPRAVASLYSMLRAHRPASMGAVVDAGAGRFIVSNSPETLLDVRLGAGRGGSTVVRSWPIKGTRPRYADPAADDAARRELWNSAKDRAEHVMIVDLVRNDLGRLAIPGTVVAAAKPQPLLLPTVHHLVTEVRAEVPAATSLRALVEAVFPGGSITGAPKRRTVELIDAIEQHERGIYCGALVVLEPTGARLSIPIRTGLVDARGLSLCAGGGIVSDSDPEAERRETVDKTRAFAPVELPP